MPSAVSALPKYRPPLLDGLPAAVACVDEACDEPAPCRYWQRYRRSGRMHVTAVYRCTSCGHDIQIEYPME